MRVWLRFMWRGLAVALAAGVLAALVGSFWRTVIVRRTNQADGVVPMWADQDTWEVRLEAGHVVVERQRANPVELERIRELEDDMEFMVQNDVEDRLRRREMDEFGASVFGSTRAGGVFYDRDGTECQDLLVRNGKWESQQDPIVPRYPPYQRRFDRFTRADSWQLHLLTDKAVASPWQSNWKWWVFERDSGLQTDTWRAGMFFPSAAIFAAVGFSALNWYRHRHRAGHCPTCGYDLRASPGRCPECGKSLAA